MFYKHLKYLQAARFRTVMKRSVSFNAFAIDICIQAQKEFGYAEVSFVAGDHETRVTVAICNFNIYPNIRQEKAIKSGTDNDPCHM